MVNYIRHGVGALLALLCFVGCAGGNGTIGNGTVDPIERAVLGIAVGVVLGQNVEMAEAAYAVSSAVLEIVGEDARFSADTIDSVVEGEIDKLNFPPRDRELAVVMYQLIKAAVSAKLGEYVTTTDVPIADLVSIVRDAAKYKLDVR